MMDTDKSVRPKTNSTQQLQQISNHQQVISQQINLQPNSQHSQKQCRHQWPHQPLHLTLFEAGVASRRESHNLLTSGRITANGRPISDFFDPGGDVVCAQSRSFSLEDLRCKISKSSGAFCSNEIGEVKIDDVVEDDSGGEGECIRHDNGYDAKSTYGMNSYNSKAHLILRLDGKIFDIQPQKLRYLLIHKPRGVLCSCTKENREWVIDNVKKKRKNEPIDDSPPIITSLIPPHITERLGYAGRLDLDSEGLVLMTNDHLLMDKLLQPGSSCCKVYEVIVLGSPDDESLENLRHGAVIGNLGQLMPCDIEFLERMEMNCLPKEEGGIEGDIRGYTKFRVTLREGKKNQIRRMFGSKGHRVVRLLRISIGPLFLGALVKGESRELTVEEIDDLRLCCDSSS